MIRTLTCFIGLAFIFSSFSGCESNKPLATGMKLCDSTIDLDQKDLSLSGKWVFKAHSSAGLAMANCKPNSVKEMSLEFKGNGALTGQSSCNSLGAKYEADGTVLSLTGLFYTEMACGESEGEVMKWENLYLQGLQGTTTFEITGNSLHLKTNNGKDLFFLRASE